MIENKTKQNNFRVFKLINGIIIICLFGVFPIFEISANTDFTVLTTTENVPTGNTNQTIGIAESVANVSIGEDTQTNTVGVTTANVSQQKASKTVSVGTLPADGESIVIGSCVVAFVATLGMTADQTDCSSNTATIDTNVNIGDTDRTPSEIATIISNLTNVSDPVHGTLASSLHSNAVIFTTAGTETSATEINFADYTGGKITTTASSAGILPVAQVSTVTPANIETGDTFTVIINGTTISYTTLFNTVATVTAGLTAAINVSSQSANVTATDQGTRVDVTSDTAGTAFTIAGGTANRTTTVAQVNTVTPANVEVGDTFTVIVNGATISYTATDSAVANVTVGLTAAINSSSQASAVTATNQTVRLDVTADTAGTPFTITGGTTNRPPVAQVSTVTPINVKEEETVLVSINGTNYYYTTKVGDTIQAVVTGLKSAITNTDVTVTGTDYLVLTANTAGTAFTVDAEFSEIVLSNTYGITREDFKIGNLNAKLRIGDISNYTAKIIWNTDTPAEGILYVTKMKNKLKKTNLSSSLLSFNDSTSSITHGFLLSGLKKKSKHYFIIVSGDSRSKIFSFKTKSPRQLIY